MVAGEAVYGGFVNGGVAGPLPERAPHDHDTGATVVVGGSDFLTSPSEAAFVPRAGVGTAGREG
jgi:hypothetical protein